MAVAPDVRGVAGLGASVVDEHPAGAGTGGDDVGGLPAREGMDEPEDVAIGR